VHISHEDAGPKIAAIFSIVESCRRLGLPIREYLAAVLPGLANRSTQSLAQLTPGCLRRQQNRLTYPTTPAPANRVLALTHTVERSFAHCYETGGMRRCTLRGQENILKRLVIYVGAFNISLVLRKMLGAGSTPRELRNRAARLLLRLFEWLTCRYRPIGVVESRTTPVLALFGIYRSVKPQYRLNWNSATFATGC
jgi:hypothetical protein